MAITAAKSDQVLARSTDGARLKTVEEHGKFRVQYFYYKNTTGAALDDGSTIDLVVLPFGTVRILPGLCRLRTTAFGAARVLKIGHKAYQSTGNAGNNVADDDDAFVSGVDISAAIANTALATTIKFDIYSRAEVTLYATVTGGTIPINAEIEGYFTYIYE